MLPPPDETGWAAQLGRARHEREESAAQLARSQQADAAHAAAISTDRWLGIVAAMRRHAEAYNAGARRLILDVQHTGDSTVTIAAGGEGAPSLTATLEGTLICMMARDALGIPHATEFRLHPDRGDDDTAAYLLQNWMERL